MCLVDIYNKPYKSREGRDIEDAWSTVELLDGNSKTVFSWRDLRCEDNKQPGYGDHPIDHYPDDQKVRTLSANGRPNVLCIALKPVADEFAYPFRGEDQIQPDWRATDIKIPVGKYLLKLSIHGKGLDKPAEHLFEFENLGANHAIELREKGEESQKNDACRHESKVAAQGTLRLFPAVACGSRDSQVNGSFPREHESRGGGSRMARIAILERADMNTEQARVYDAAKQSSGIVGGPYYSCVRGNLRIPQVFVEEGIRLART
jgi:hypothetical protein